MTENLQNIALICDSSNSNCVDNTNTTHETNSPLNVKFNGYKLDFNQLKTELKHRIPQIVKDLLPNGKKSGKNWIARDTITGEKKPSLLVNLEDGNFRNQATNESGGDIIALTSYLQGKPAKDAAQWLHSTYCNGNSHLPAQIDKPAKKEKSVLIFNNSDDATKHLEKSRPVALIHPYHDDTGNHIITVYRVDSNKGKEYPTLYLNDDGKWQFKKPDKFKTQKLPLFNLSEIIANPDKPLLFCEGEKATNSAKTLFLDHTHTTTLGGANNSEKTDFSPVNGRDVLIYPDNDKAGQEYANKVANLCLVHGAKSVEIVQIPSGKPAKYDAYDAVNEGITSADVATWSKVKFTSENKQQATGNQQPKEKSVVANEQSENTPAANSNEQPADVGSIRLQINKLKKGDNADELIRLIANSEISNSIQDSLVTLIAKQTGLRRTALNEDFLEEKRKVKSAKKVAEKAESGGTKLGFNMTGRGLIHLSTNDIGLIVHITITHTSFDVVANTTDLNGEHGKLIRFNSQDVIVALRDTAGSGEAYRGDLQGKGMIIMPDKTARQKLTEYILNSKPSETKQVLNKIGWINNGNTYVLPDMVFNRENTDSSLSSDEIYLNLGNSSKNLYTSKGTLTEWQENVASYCTGNSILMFAMSYGFASMLLEYSPITDSGGINLKGDSSIGKSTVLRIVASIFGNRNFIKQWRATGNALEATAALHNDGLLCLDELGQIEPNEAGQIAYMLANGQGKQRMDRNAVLKTILTWRLLFLSTGEIGLADIRINGKRNKAGQEIRMIDIPCKVSDYGIFENLHGEFSDGATFSDFLSSNARKYHGTAQRAFLAELLNTPYDVIADKIAEYMTKFNALVLTKDKDGKEPDGQVKRVCNRFALAVAGGLLATQFGITGWTTKEVINSGIACFKRWLNERGTTGNLETRNAIADVRHFFERYGLSRFKDIADNGDGERIINDLAGFRETTKKETSNAGDAIEYVTHYYVLNHVFTEQMCNGYDAKQVAKSLVEHRILLTENNGKTSIVKRLPIFGNTRVYHFTSESLSESE